MTRKDYELIADAIDHSMARIVRHTRHDHGQRADQLAGIIAAASTLSRDLESENKRFDRKRFIEAATAGPMYRAAINDEALARELGPCDSQATNTTDRHVKLAP